MVFILSENNTIANRFLAELRNTEVQKDRLRFRYNLERLGEILAYEFSKTLSYEMVEIETPLGTATHMLPTQRVVLSTILRAGLPMHKGMLNYFDQADNAFISAFRKEHKDGTLEVQLDYISAPSVEDSVLVMCDPMIATGSSAILSLERLLERGTPQQLHIVSAICSAAGLEALRRRFPKAMFWIGALDEELTAKSYIVPGLGDAGDLAFGEKE